MKGVYGSEVLGRVDTERWLGVNVDMVEGKMKIDEHYLEEN